METDGVSVHGGDVARRAIAIGGEGLREDAAGEMLER